MFTGILFSSSDPDLDTHVRELDERIALLFPEFAGGRASAHLRLGLDEFSGRGVSLAPCYLPPAGEALAFYFGPVVDDGPSGEFVLDLPPFRVGGRTWHPSIDAAAVCRSPSPPAGNAALFNHTCHGATVVLRQPVELRNCRLPCAALLGARPGPSRVRTSPSRTGPGPHPAPRTTAGLLRRRSARAALLPAPAGPGAPPAPGCTRGPLARRPRRWPRPLRGRRIRPIPLRPGQLHTATIRPHDRLPQHGGLQTGPGGGKLALERPHGDPDPRGLRPDPCLCRAAWLAHRAVALQRPRAGPPGGLPRPLLLGPSPPTLAPVAESPPSPTPSPLSTSSCAPWSGPKGLGLNT
jgi:hypothetical protein